MAYFYMKIDMSYNENGYKRIDRYLRTKSNKSNFVLHTTQIDFMFTSNLQPINNLLSNKQAKRNPWIVYAIIVKLFQWSLHYKLKDKGKIWCDQLFCNNRNYAHIPNQNENSLLKLYNKLNDILL
jgi:hypothetical protein